MCQIIVICGKCWFSSIIQRKQRLKRIESFEKFTEMLLWAKQRAVIGFVVLKMVIFILYWRPTAWRKPKNILRHWIGGIVRWEFSPNAKGACFSIRSYLPSHFQTITCVGDDSKARNLGSLWFKAERVERRLIWLICKCLNNCSNGKKGRFSSSDSHGWWKMDPLQQPKEKKILGSAWSYDRRKSSLPANDDYLAHNQIFLDNHK